MPLHLRPLIVILSAAALAGCSGQKREQSAGDAPESGAKAMQEAAASLRKGG